MNGKKVKSVHPELLKPEVGFTPSGKGVVFRQQARRIGNSMALTSAFLGDFQEVWDREGIEVIWWVRRNCPLEFFKAAVKLARVIRLEVGGTGAFDRTNSRAEILAKMEERKGPEGRKMLEQFLAKLDRLEQGEAEPPA